MSRYHFIFLAIALGMLIKGPVVVVLIGISLFSWAMWQGCFKVAIKGLPWLTGMLVFSVLTLPWYIWAEISTPGFLGYFILGEHVQRFIVSGWQGDLYGTAHVKPRGIIWLYWLICASPWSFIVIGLIIKKYRGIALPQNKYQALGINKYLVCWMISPLLLFTLAGNVLPIYVLPGISALAVLVALNCRLTKLSNYLAFSSFALLVLAIIVLSLGLVHTKSEAELLGVNRGFSQYTALYYWNKRPFSAQFYSKGQAQLLDNKDKLNTLLTSEESFYIAIKPSDFEVLQQTLTPLCLVTNQSKSRLLLKCK